MFHHYIEEPRCQRDILWLIVMALTVQPEAKFIDVLRDQATDEQP